jgi:hypothetical protein
MVPEDRFRLVPEGGYGDVGSQGLIGDSSRWARTSPAGQTGERSVGLRSVAGQRGNRCRQRVKSREPGTEGNAALLGKGTGRRPGRRPAAGPP